MEALFQHSIYILYLQAEQWWNLLMSKADQQELFEPWNCFVLAMESLEQCNLLPDLFPATEPFMSSLL